VKVKESLISEINLITYIKEDQAVHLFQTTHQSSKEVVCSLISNLSLIILPWE
jgi:hypothetical protein